MEEWKKPWGNANYADQECAWTNVRITGHCSADTTPSLCFLRQQTIQFFEMISTIPHQVLTMYVPCHETDATSKGFDDDESETSDTIYGP